MTTCRRSPARAPGTSSRPSATARSVVASTAFAYARLQATRVCPGPRRHMGTGTVSSIWRSSAHFRRRGLLRPLRRRRAATTCRRRPRFAVRVSYTHCRCGWRKRPKRQRLASAAPAAPVPAVSHRQGSAQRGIRGSRPARRGFQRRPVSAHQRNHSSGTVLSAAHAARASPSCLRACNNSMANTSVTTRPTQRPILPTPLALEDKRQPLPVARPGSTRTISRRLPHFKSIRCHIYS